MARSYRVELEVEDDGLSFTLDDAIKGVLDNTTYTLALAFTDITEYVYSVGVKRGRNRDLSRFSAGSMTVQLRNNDRTFDPLNTASPFYGQILPRRRMRVWVDQILTYVGFIEFWDFTYSVSGESLVSVSVNDAFTVLAQQELVPAAVSEETSGARVNAILNNGGVAWSTSDRDVDNGYSVLAGGTAVGNALQYLQQVETSENGLLFIGKEGDVVFRGRNATPNTAGILDFSDTERSEVYSWTGDYNASTSVGVIDGVSWTNLATNPSMEAASGTVTVRENLVTNPSFEVDTTGWVSSATITRVNTESYVGSWCLQVVHTALDQVSYIANTVTASQTYVSSAWVKAEAGKTFRIELREYTSGGVIVGTTSSSDITGTGAWQRVEISRTFGSTGVSAYIQIRNRTAGAHTFYVDAVQLEVGATASDYFDGSTAASGDFTYAWSGTANASTSLQRGVPVTGYTLVNGISVSSTDWAGTGTKSQRIVPSTSSNNSFARFDLATVIGATYTVKAKVRLTAPQIGTLATLRRIIFVTRGSDSTELARSAEAPNEAGVTELTATFTATETTSRIRLYNGASAGNGDVWWDDLIVVEGTYTGDYFDGSTQSFYNGIPYTEANINYGTDLMVNSAVVEYPGGTETKVNNASSASYGIIEETFETFLSTQSQAVNYAEYVVGKYGQPEYRFDTLRISLDGLTDAQKTDLLLREIGDLARVTFTPNNIGSPIVRLGQITSIDHAIGVDRHDVIVGFTSVEFVGLILDDAVFGILDLGLLGY